MLNFVIALAPILASISFAALAKKRKNREHY